MTAMEAREKLMEMAEAALRLAEEEIAPYRCIQGEIGDGPPPAGPATADYGPFADGYLAQAEAFVLGALVLNELPAGVAP